MIADAKGSLKNARLVTIGVFDASGSLFGSTLCLLYGSMLASVCLDEFFGRREGRQ